MATHPVFSYLFMGVSGAGKSRVGGLVAQQLNARFIDGDDLHPRCNILKMQSGQPLNDADREVWLERINDVVFSLQSRRETGIIACSALKRKYREAIRRANAQCRFLHLHADFDLVLQRMRGRENHFMPAPLLQSQFATLEMPTDDETDVRQIDNSASLQEVVTSCLAAIHSWEAGLP